MEQDGAIVVGADGMGSSSFLLRVIFRFNRLRNKRNDHTLIEIDCGY
jgi:hypothetical protein